MKAAKVERESWRRVSEATQTSTRGSRQEEQVQTQSNRVVKAKEKRRLNFFGESRQSLQPRCVPEKLRAAVHWATNLQHNPSSVDSGAATKLRRSTEFETEKKVTTEPVTTVKQ